jgi:cysteine synthase A
LGGTVVEATSGNMGIGLALVAALRGLKCVLTMPDSMSVERRSLLKALGAELVLTPAAGGMSAAVAESKKIAAERGGWIPGQFTNPLAVQAHYENTGPEIYKDCGGRMDAIVSAVGSGSTLMGAGRYLKEHIPGFRMIAVEPKDSPVLSGGRPGAHVIQGIGAGFVPAIVDASLIDEILTADGEAAFSMARRLMKSDGVVAGISTGANVMAALEVAGREEMRGKNVVTFACDTGERYMSTALFQKN